MSNKWIFLLLLFCVLCQKSNQLFCDATLGEGISVGTPCVLTHYHVQLWKKYFQL